MWGWCVCFSSGFGFIFGVSCKNWLLGENGLELVTLEWGSGLGSFGRWVVPREVLQTFCLKRL